MQLFTLENEKIKIVVSDLGASWHSCHFANRALLVTTSTENWCDQTAYFGGTIGRYANRIANGQYVLNEKLFRLKKNNGQNNLHGGEIGADKCYWIAKCDYPNEVQFHKIFADGEEGFGGEVQASVRYYLEENRLLISFEAFSDQDTPLCLTNHAYFNLSTEPTIHQHYLTVNADHYLPVDEQGIPYKDLTPVANSGFDFRYTKQIGEHLLKDEDQKKVKGYDHAFLLTKKSAEATACPPDVVLNADNIRLEVRTTMPAVQIYTGNWLGGEPDLQGNPYPDYAGIAIEPEFLPDTPNHPEWWQFGGITKKGEIYRHQIEYRFFED